MTLAIYRIVLTKLYERAAFSGLSHELMCISFFHMCGLPKYILGIDYILPPPEYVLGQNGTIPLWGKTDYILPFPLNHLNTLRQNGLIAFWVKQIVFNLIPTRVCFRGQRLIPLIPTSPSQNIFWGRTNWFQCVNPGFSTGGANLWLWGKNLLFYKVFFENCMKLKEIGPRWGRTSPGSANGIHCG